MEGSHITYAESLRFRQGRCVWWVVFGVAALAFFLHSAVLLTVSLPIYFVLTIYLLFWPCPRCGCLYSIRFYWFFGIAWPWVDSCLHCGSELITKPTAPNDSTGIGT
jgi:hypothetical protein